MTTSYLPRRYLPLLLAALTLLLALAATFILWSNAENIAEQNLRAEFDFEVRDQILRIERRMGIYEQVLRGTAGFLRGSKEVSRDEYRSYIDTLKLNEYFPGIQGIGLAEIIKPAEISEHIASVRKEGFPDYIIWPESERDIYTAITMLEPFNQMNQRAFGYDMFSEPMRRQAMAAARDSGNASMSGKVILVQEAGREVQPGFLMYLPLYARNSPTETIEQRRAAILGWVYAPFRMHDFMYGLQGLISRDLYVAVYDGPNPYVQSCLFGCTGDDARASLLQTTNRIGIAGRPWTVVIRSTPAFEARTQTALPYWIAGGGIVISVLLAWGVWILAAGRSRAMALAETMTQELRNSRDRIAADQRRMQSILENSYDAFVATDRDGVISDWNAAAERTFGWSASEAIGKDIASLILPPGKAASQEAGLAGILSSTSGPACDRRAEIGARRRDGREIPVELSLASIESGSGPATRTAMHAFIRDLSEQKATEQREAKRQKALEEARAALQRGLRLEAIGKLTGGVAHDFNNMLQIISGNVQLLLYVAEGDARFAKRLEAVMQAVDRGAKLSSQLLSFARRQPLQPQAVNLRKLLGSMEDLIHRALGDEVEIESAARADLWNALADPTQLENVILNFVINARDAMNAQGKLTIELDNAILDEEYAAPFPDVNPGQYVMLAVSDTGTGMTEEVMEHAFEPFFTTKPQGEGTGLGLSMAYGFVKQSGGHIRLYSEPGHGTTIKMYLPRSMEEEADMPAAEPAAAAGGHETVLVVEDEPDVRAAAVATLRDLGYDVLQANDGESALQVLHSRSDIALLFTDVIMPGPVTSTALAEEAKRMYPQIAVLFTSGYTHNAIVHSGRLDPGVQLLTKPYRREELARKIRRVLEAQASG